MGQVFNFDILLLSFLYRFLRFAICTVIQFYFSAVCSTCTIIHVTDLFKTSVTSGYLLFVEVGVHEIGLCFPVRAPTSIAVLS